MKLEMIQSVAPVLAGLVSVCRAQFADKNANYVDEEDHVDDQTDQAGRVGADPRPADAWPLQAENMK